MIYGFFLSQSRQPHHSLLLHIIHGLCIDRRRSDVAMPKQLARGVQVGTMLQCHHREGVSRHVEFQRLVQSHILGPPFSVPRRPADKIKVMAENGVCPSIDTGSCRFKYDIPGFDTRIRNAYVPAARKSTILSWPWEDSGCMLYNAIFLFPLNNREFQNKIGGLCLFQYIVENQIRYEKL